MKDWIVKEQRFLNYVVAGGLAYFFELGVLLTLHNWLNFSVTLATGIAFWIGLASAFLLQKVLAFRDYRKSVRAISGQLSVYIGLVFFNYIFTLALVSVLADKYLIASRTLALGITTLWNYVIYKKIIFNPQADTRNLISSVSRHIERIFMQLYKSRKFNYTLTALALLLLTVCTIYGTVKTSQLTIQSADAIVNTYLVGDGIQNAKINLQPEHTNILKFPLFYIQSLFGNTLTTFTILNAILMLGAVLGWTLLLIRMLGRSHTVLIASVMAAFVFGSVGFNLFTTWTTIRNIEFPLALIYVLMITDFMARKAAVTRRDALLLLCATVLYGALLASDLFFQYTLSLAIMGFLMLVYAQTQKLTLRVILVALSVVAASIIGKLLIFALDLLGYISIYPGSFPRTLVPFDRLFSELATALIQLFDLAGGQVFDIPISLSNAGVFVNAALLFVTIIGGYLLISNGNKQLLHDKPDIHAVQTPPALLILALTFFITFAIYALTGQVVSGSPRYMTFMIFLAVPLIVWVIKHYYAAHIVLRTGVTGIILLGIVANTQRVPTLYSATQKSLSAEASRYENITQILRSKGVSAVLTGHWLGAPTRFWSQDKVEIAPIQGCNRMFTALTRQDWYGPDQNIKSALIIEREGSDAPFWAGCTDDRLLDIYGEPAEKIKLDGERVIWIYDYDARSRVIL